MAFRSRCSVEFEKMVSWILRQVMLSCFAVAHDCQVQLAAAVLHNFLVFVAEGAVEEEKLSNPVILFR